MVQAPPEPLGARRMHSCTEVLASFTVGRDRVTELLPPGFRFGNTAATALRADRETSAEILIGVMHPARARHDLDGGSAVSGMALGMLVAEPPHPLELAGADLQGVCLFAIDGGSILVETEDLASGEHRIEVRGTDDSVELGMTCYVSALGAVHVPPRRSRIFVKSAGEGEGILDLTCTGAVGSPSGLACVELEGIPTLPTVMEGTAVRSSGFDARVEPLLAPPFAIAGTT